MLKITKYWQIASHLTPVNMLNTHGCACKKEFMTQESQDAVGKMKVPLNYYITTIILEVFEIFSDLCTQTKDTNPGFHPHIIGGCNLL